VAEGTGLAIHGIDFAAAGALAPPGLSLSGNADGTIVQQLRELVAELHRSLVEASARRVRVDLRGLEFMSASCFNVFVSWLTLILELAPGDRYQLVFAPNATIPWQRRSLHTLSCFATDLVTIESSPW
jgi:hypothetical protein